MTYECIVSLCKLKASHNKEGVKTEIIIESSPSLTTTVVSIKYNGICANSHNFSVQILRIPALSNSSEFVLTFRQG